MNKSNYKYLSNKEKNDIYYSERLIDYLLFELDLLKEAGDPLPSRIEYSIVDIFYTLIEKGLDRKEIERVNYYFNRILKGKPLNALLGLDEEWEIKRGKDYDIFINKRCKSVIKLPNGEAVDLDTFIFSEDGGKTWKKKEWYEYDFPFIEFPYLPPTEPIEIIIGEEK